MSKKNRMLEKQKQIKETMQQREKDNQPSKLNILAWAATPFVITGFGNVMKEILKNLFKSYPGVYNIYLVGINFHGDHQDEFSITGGLENGRLIQWPAMAHMQGGQMNLYGQQKFLDVVKNIEVDIDAVLLFEDPFWVGGNVPGTNTPFIDAIRSELAARGRGHVPTIGYFPIDGTPKTSWIQNIAKIDIPITYLRFGAEACLRACPELKGRLGIIPHGVNDKEFFPIPKQESKLFKRAMFGERAADKFMLLNVNRNQLRKLIPSSILAFKELKKVVPNSFYYLNMKAVDVGWDLISICNSLGLHIGEDIMFPPDFLVQKGLSIEDLNKVFNCADVLVSTATGGGWELAVTQAFATRTLNVVPANTSHVELCGNQEDINETRGILYRSGSNLAQLTVFNSDNEVVRPLPDLDDMVVKLKWVADNRENDVCNKIRDNAYNWTKNELSWEKHIVPKFHNAFNMAKNLKTQRLQQINQQKPK